MRIQNSRSSRILIASLAAVGLLATASTKILADEFENTLALVDRALETNPKHVVPHALDTCMSRRMYATQLYRAGHTARAERSLKYCVKLLNISEPIPVPQVERNKELAKARAKVQAKSAKELEKALTLTPNIKNGLEIYRGCAACHTPEGWGLAS